jgi:hypothetical protein
MISKFTALVLLLLFAVSAQAQTPKPATNHGFFNIGDGLPRKHFFTDPKWWIGEGVILVSITADGYTTARRTPGLTERSWFLGPNPSIRRVEGVSLLNAAVQTTLHAGAWHFTHGPILFSDGTVSNQDKLGWRIVGYTGVPTSVALIAGRDAIKNYQLINQSKK